MWPSTSFKLKAKAWMTGTSPAVTGERNPKEKRARGRIALSDVDLQPLGLVGGSKGSLYRFAVSR